MRGAEIDDLPGHFGAKRAKEPRLWTLISTYALDRISLDARQATAQDLTDLRAGQRDLAGDLVRGVSVGMHRDPVWGDLTYDEWVQAQAQGRTPPYMDAPTLAHTADADLFHVATAQAHPAYRFDIERHDPAYLLAWLREWRALRPTRATEWTLEPRQRGWFTPELISTLRLDVHLTVIPQTFRGRMQPVAQDAVWRELAAALVPTQVKLCYDAQHGAPEAMDGFLFTLERLPAP